MSFNPWERNWYFFADIYTLMTGVCGHTYLIEKLIELAETDITKVQEILDLCDVILRSPGEAPSPGDEAISSIRRLAFVVLRNGCWLSRQKNHVNT